MPLRPGTSSPLPAADYRRQARHLRWVHRHNPTQLHHSLRDLSRPKAEAADPTSRFSLLDSRSSLQAPAPPAGDFAALVASQLDGPILRYSRRLALLKEASRRGISRFDANLLIAAVQNRYPRPVERPLRQFELPTRILLFFAVQAAILIAAWCLFSA